MPRVGWIHPLTGARVPPGYFEHDVSAGGRPAFPAALAAAANAAQGERGDARHGTLELTVTRLLTCPRATFLEVLVPYCVDPRRVAARERGTVMHAALAAHQPAHVKTEVVVRGALFGGYPVSGRVDMVELDAQGRVVGLGDIKCPNDESVRYRAKVAPGVTDARKMVGAAKLDHALQLNMLRLLVAQQPWGASMDAARVPMTVWDYGCLGDEGPVPLAAPVMSEEEMWLAKPAVYPPGHKYFDRGVWERVATLGEIVGEHWAALLRYAAVPEALRSERVVIEEQVIAPMKLIGQRGMLGGKMCTRYCDVAGECGAAVRKYGGVV
jgi:hypothetical protein